MSNHPVLLMRQDELLRSINERLGVLMGLLGSERAGSDLDPLDGQIWNDAYLVSRVQERARKISEKEEEERDAQERAEKMHRYGISL